MAAVLPELAQTDFEHRMVGESLTTSSDSRPLAANAARAPSLRDCDARTSRPALRWCACGCLWANWWTRRRDGLARRWARLRGHPVPVGLAASLGLSGALATVTVPRARVDRATVSDREWLAHLDDQIEALYQVLDETRTADREAFDQGLTAQRETLRAEILRGTRDGWKLVAAGLLLSAAGILLGWLA